MIIVAVFTLIGAAAGAWSVATHPGEAPDDKLATVLILTFVGFVTGWLVLLVAQHLDVVRSIP